MRKALLFALMLAIALYPSGCSAYTLFSNNSYLDSYTNFSGQNVSNGLVLFGNSYNATMRYNDTCNGLSTCAIIENNGTSQTNYLFLQQYDWLAVDGKSPFWSPSLGDLFTFDSSNQKEGVGYIQLLLPAYQEGILKFNYRFNTSITTPAPHVSIDDLSMGTIAFIDLSSNVTANIWYNVSYIVNASTFARKLRIYFFWNFDNIASSVKIDKFKFYTLSAYETKSEWSSNITVEQLDYCGAGSTFFEGKYGTVTNNNSARFFIATDNESNKCMVMKLGGTTVARRATPNSVWTYHSSPPYLYGLAESSQYDYYIMQSGFNAGIADCESQFLNFAGIFEALSLTSAKITTVCSSTDVNQIVSANNSSFGNHACNDAYTSRQCLKYNGAETFSISLSWLFSLHPNSLRETVTLLSFPNIISPSTNPTGTAFRWWWSNQGYESSQYYNFFSATSQTCENKGWSCSLYTNNETYVDSNCNITQNNYCGDLGCGATRCNYLSCNASWYCLGNQEYYQDSICNQIQIASCGSCGCAGSGAGYRCNPVGSYWQCNSQYESWHYTDCANDLQLLCDLPCDNVTGQCGGEVNCLSDGDCSSYCYDASTLYSGGSCNLTSYSCSYSAHQACQYGCISGGCSSFQRTSPLLGTDLTPAGIISGMYLGVLGFVNNMGGSFFMVMFLLIAVVVIIMILTAVGKIIKSSVD